MRQTMLGAFLGCVLPASAIRNFQATNRSIAATKSATTGKVAYTTNAICLERHCINPLVPGLMYFDKNVLTANQNRAWSCVDSAEMWKLAGFCDRVVVGYKFAVPVPDDGIKLQEDLVVEQSKLAVTAYVAHLAGMGFDFWDHTEPWNDDPCIRTVWKMACYTHFPRCNQINEGEYLRPCRSSCENYLNECKVTCCDEAVQCVYTHTKDFGGGVTEVDEGYIDHVGPSPLCTGAAVPQATPLSSICFIALALALCAQRV